MEENIKESLIENLKSSLYTQSRISLKLDINGRIGKTIYNKEDLENASLIFIHILSNISAGYCLKEKGMNIEQAGLIATEIGNNLRQTILLSTGIDMYKKKE